MKSLRWRRWLWAEVLLLGLLLPWLWGGRAAVVPWVIAGGAVVVAVTWGGLRRWGRPEERPQLECWAWVALGAWAGLVGLWALGALNPSMAWVERAGGQRLLLPVAEVRGGPTMLEVGRGMRFAMSWVGVLAIGWCVATVRWEGRERRRWWWLWGGQACVLALIGLWFRASGAGLMLGFETPVNPSFFATYRYHNHWVAYAVLGLGWLLAALFSGDSRWRRNDPRWLAVAGGSFLWVSLSFCGSRSGVVFALVMLGAVLWGLRRRRWISRRGWWLGGVALLVGGIVSGPALVDRWEGTQEQWEAYRTTGERDIRLGAGPTATWQLIEARPWWGWGPGSYVYAFPTVAGEAFYYESWGRVRLHRLEFAHNDWLQFTSEIGVVGMLLALGPLLWWVGRRRRNPGDIWTGGALLLVALLALWDFPLSNFSILALAGWSLATWGRAPSARQPID